MIFVHDRAHDYFARGKGNRNVNLCFMSVESQKIRRGESRSGWTDLNPGHVKGVLNIYFAQEKKLWIDSFMF